MLNITNLLTHSYSLSLPKFFQLWCLCFPPAAELLALIMWYLIETQLHSAKAISQFAAGQKSLY